MLFLGVYDPTHFLILDKVMPPHQGHEQSQTNRYPNVSDTGGRNEPPIVFKPPNYHSSLQEKINEDHLIKTNVTYICNLDPEKHLNRKKDHKKKITNSITINKNTSFPNGERTGQNNENLNQQA